MIRVPFEGEKRSEDGSAGDGITGGESTGSLCGRHELKLDPHSPALEQL